MTNAGISREMLLDDDVDDELVVQATDIMNRVTGIFPSLRQWAEENGHSEVLVKGHATGNKKRVKGRASKKAWNSTTYRSKADRKSKGGKTKKKVVTAEEE